MKNVFVVFFAPRAEKRRNFDMGFSKSFTGVFFTPFAEKRTKTPQKKVPTCLFYWRSARYTPLTTQIYLPPPLVAICTYTHTD
jgi:hypothetical protein